MRYLILPISVFHTVVVTALPCGVGDDGALGEVRVAEELLSPKVAAVSDILDRKTLSQIPFQIRLEKDREISAEMTIYIDWDLYQIALEKRW